MKPSLRLLRPHQWLKNGICFAGLFFGGRFGSLEAVRLASLTFVCFCAASSCAYVLNDIMDRERDRDHELKRMRPIASGEIGVGRALVILVFLSIIAIGFGLMLGQAGLVCVLLYLANNVGYSIWGKHVAILDVMSIAFGFVLRLVSGIFVIGEHPTGWILVCTFFLAVFLGFVKRRAELDRGADSAEGVRPVLLKYQESFLNGMIIGTGSCATMAYALFTLNGGETNPALVATVPFVFYVITHVSRRVMASMVACEVDVFLVREWRIPVIVVLWLTLYGLIRYIDPKIVE
jgi:4-hydroxybenzoate polyprenyltransferase